jgi:tRNA-2-methylthio-N6-dimethylallyladenosine synthase
LDIFLDYKQKKEGFYLVKKKVYIETYGCQMNLADSEVVASILESSGFDFTKRIEEADITLINTCSIRDHAEQRVIGRLGEFKRLKSQNPQLVIGVLGCMAERLRNKLLDHLRLVDVIVGPDEYRKLPDLIGAACEGEKGIAVKLSRVENYDDIIPLRTDGVSAWVSVMRGCDKFCTFCVVPFTRGRERSRTLDSVVSEIEELVRRGFREVTLLGQNVNSYADSIHDFADLLIAVAGVDTDLRVRFTTSHPKDMSDKLIDAIATYPNICNYIHLPVQSGSDRILELMNRTYTIEHYLRLVEKIKERIPGVALTTDIIAGFPGETEKDHNATLEVLRTVRYDGAFMFKYSPRENTKAWNMIDNVADEEKTRRLNDIIDLQRSLSLEINKALIGRSAEVLVEGPSKKSDEYYAGRTDTNKTVIFPSGNFSAGDYINVRMYDANAATLFGNVITDQGWVDVRIAVHG